MKKLRRRIIVLVIICSFTGTCFVACSDDQMKNIAENVESAVTGNQPLQVESVSQDRYAYNTLDDETKVVYDEILYTLQNREKDIQLATTDIAVMELAYKAVRYDYCDIFWLDQFSYVTYNRDDEITAIVLTPEYSMSEARQADIQKEIDRNVDELLAGLDEDASDFDKVLYVYDTLIENIDYVIDSENNQNIISAFINRKTICQGYAYATQYMLNRLGIPCTTITGFADGEPHAWNLVTMDGAYYYVDTTWGNSQYAYRDEEEESDLSKYIDYNYMGANSEIMASTHTPDADIPLPECNSLRDNYYIHEGKYIEEWNPDYIGQVIAEGREEGSDLVQIKFSDTEIFDQALSYFIEDFHVRDYCPDITSVKYMENAGNNVLFFKF